MPAGDRLRHSHSPAEVGQPLEQALGVAAPVALERVLEFIGEWLAAGVERGHAEARPSGARLARTSLTM